jgi:electron transfer flavoprotein alpha subunit
LLTPGFRLQIHVLVAGKGCGAVADAAALIDGVAKVLVADDEVCALILPVAV